MRPSTEACALVDGKETYKAVLEAIGMATREVNKKIETIFFKGTSAKKKEDKEQHLPNKDFSFFLSSCFFRPSKKRKKNEGFSVLNFLLDFHYRLVL